MSATPYAPRGRFWRTAINRTALSFARHWMIIFNLLIAVWVGLPWLAPVFLHWGWGGAANSVYSFYAFQCHQLPERSFFLFGPKPMYSLIEIQAAWQNTTDSSVLRQWIGNVDMGWKVAWSDRMVSMYSSLLLAGIVYAYAFVRRRIRPLPLWGFALLLLPMLVDGGTHMISDLTGIGQGFRDTNLWLAALTGDIFPSTFYAGDALGSFNSWMRLITGVFFGIAVIWLAYPAIDGFFADYVLLIENKFRRAGLKP